MNKNTEKEKELSKSLLREFHAEFDIFQKGEVVWHSNFKCKCEYQHIQNKGRDGRYWHKIKLPNGGLMDTQFIEKYNGQR